MAKAAKKPKAPKKKSAAKAQPIHDEHHIDGCLCGSDVPDNLYTRDEDLPAAKGGVARR